MFIRAYLRASTEDQDAERAREDLIRFAEERGMRIASWYVENESGASLQRPELQRLLSDATPGDVLLIEQVDRLSRLNADDWDQLRAMLKAKRVRVVALDLPTSWSAISGDDEFTVRMAEAINGMMLDMLAAIARKDYTDRRRRQAQGIERAKTEGKFRGRKADKGRNEAISKLLSSGQSWATIIAATGCSRDTVARVSKSLRDGAGQ